MIIFFLVANLILTVMTLPTTVMTVFVLFFKVTMVIMTLVRCSPLSPPITVTLLPIPPGNTIQEIVNSS